ncbi:hypothetical protein K1W69_02775 [Hoeflea sp. WL0058]|uniref:Uncharacterized protein n=1 Tax=Flavimaribacter sediminis TaxID=2865987 RepID=A0AAE3CZL9_9HYPH|nr:hypothetical protein [Flavimaribacter sediminis]MBW8636097.1 hypothetical protein [Flavimaribacter sediminis]
MNVNATPSEDPARAALKKLLGGVAGSNTRMTRDGWRVLYAIGTPAKPVILEQLRSPKWAEYHRGPQARFLAVLLSILNEIDSDQCARELRRLRRSKLHSLHRRTVDLLASVVADRSYCFEKRGVQITISTKLKDPEKIAKMVSRWLHTPDARDLQKLTSIDVMPFHEDLDYLGYYRTEFSKILVTWPSKNIWYRSFFYRLNAETTLYHEIGHHVCGHLEGGQVEEQEKEAKGYASRMLRRAHPLLVALAFAVGVFVMPRKVWGFVRYKLTGKKND